MNKHTCEWDDKPHVMFIIHGKDAQDCCYCNPDLTITDEPYLSILKYMNDFMNEEGRPDCCFVNIENVKYEMIRIVNEIQSGVKL